MPYECNVCRKIRNEQTGKYENPSEEVRKAYNLGLIPGGLIESTCGECSALVSQRVELETRFGPSLRTLLDNMALTTLLQFSTVKETLDEAGRRLNGSKN